MRATAGSVGDAVAFIGGSFWPIVWPLIHTVFSPSLRVTTPFNFAVWGPGGAALGELGSCLPESKMWRCAGVKNSRPNGSAAHAAFPHSVAGSRHIKSAPFTIYLLRVPWSASSVRIARSDLLGEAQEVRPDSPDPACTLSA